VRLADLGGALYPHFVRPYWKSTSGGELLVNQTPVSCVVEKYGTPLFVYDSKILERKYAGLRKALPDRFAISYSVKANPNPKVLMFFLQKGCGLEVASGGELRLAITAGCLPGSIMFAGPGKTEAELELALKERISEIHAESPLEIERISKIARRLGVVAPVALRVNPQEGQAGAMLMGGKPAPFGVDEEKLEELIPSIVSDRQLDFKGIHVFVGTQLLDCEVLLEQYRSGLKIGQHVARMAGTPLQTLDFGGGLGIPYFAGDSELDLSGLQAGLLELIAEFESEACFSPTRFIVEPGRFLVGEAGLYVTRVNDIKVSRGKKFLILDGGMNHHLAASGNLGQVIKRNFPMAVLNRLLDPPAEEVDVVGPLCTPLDTLGRSVQLPKARVGDLIGIFQSGAYARSASPLGFLSHPTPPEVWLENGQDVLIRAREQ
jgi:diaminopimelate decarboxylase